MGKINCEACNRSCKDQAIKIENQFYHLKCFKCKECNKPLATSGFYKRKMFHYCIEDYERLFGYICNICSNEIKDEVVTAQDKSYHQQCFACSNCRKILMPGERVKYNGSQYFCTSCMAGEISDIIVNIKPEYEKENQLSVSAPCTPAKLCTNDDEASKLINLDYSSDDGDGRRRSLSSKFEFKNRSCSPASLSHKSRELTSRPDSSFGRFFNTSYLELKDNFKRGPNISTSPLPSKHFHKPDKYKFNDFIKHYGKPKKQGLMYSLSCEERGINVKRMHLIDIMKSDEAIEAITLSRQPDGRPEQRDHVLPIERDDWPAPPHPAAAYPELMRDIQEKTHMEGMDTDGRISRMKREIDELTKMAEDDSGAAKVILNDLKRFESGEVSLDPRSASRTPSAAIEPMYRTRYESPLYASPSRDIDERMRLRSLECLNDRRFRTPSKISNDPLDWKEYETPKKKKVPTATLR